MNLSSPAENLRDCMTSLEARLASLLQILPTISRRASRVFILPDILKGEEHESIDEIQVQKKSDDEAFRRSLQHYNHLFIHHQSEKLSTKAAIRLPGILCLQVDYSERLIITQLVGEINHLKQKLEKIVTVESGITREERFEFIHRQLHGLLTLNAYRTITLVNNPDSVRFGWANKHIIKTLSRSEVIHRLNKSLAAERANSGLSREAWHKQLTVELELIEALPETVLLKIRRPVKVQPIARVWYGSEQKQRQLACSSPILVLCDPQQQMPDIGDLPDYDASNITHRHKPQSNNYYPLIPRMHLYRCD